MSFVNFEGAALPFLHCRRPERPVVRRRSVAPMRQSSPICVVSKMLSCDTVRGICNWKGRWRFFDVGQESLLLLLMWFLADFAQWEGASRPRGAGMERASFPAVPRHLSDGG